MTPRGVHSIANLPPGLVRSVRHSGWLEDWRLAAGLAALGLAVAVGWALVAVQDRRAGRRHRHPVVRRTGLAGLVPLLVLAGAGAGGNAHAGSAPHLPPLLRPPPRLPRRGPAPRPGHPAPRPATGPYPPPPAA